MLNSAVMTSAMQLNVFAAMALAKGLRQKGVMANSASIVWLSSVAALVGQPGVSPYAASKGALLAMCKSLALELAKEQIRINCVVPAMVQTPMAEKLFAMMTPEQVAKIELAHPLGIGQPEDVANAIAFLLSDAAKWITGSSLVVDGGYTAQ
jgi:NAD(P)-dependent dehydrogenase (short-subunit alcohol dehydrogenase family)